MTSIAHYVFKMPRARWVVRAMNWSPENARRVGRPADTWDSMIQHFYRHKQIGNWRERAQDISFWINQFDDFFGQCNLNEREIVVLAGCLLWHTGLSTSLLR